MPQRICSNDSNQFYSFTIWYSRGDINLYPYTDQPMLKLGADLNYLVSIGRTPILVQEFSPDGYQFLAAPDFSAYQAAHGDAVWSQLTGGEDPVGSITIDGFPTCYSIAGNAPGLCPPGYAWNPATEQCDPLPPPPPVVPPPISPIVPPPSPGTIVPPPNPTPPPLGQPDPGGDEITDSLCRQIAADTAAIVHAINQLQGDGGTGAAACCAAVVNAIAGIEATLIRILTVLPTLAPGKAPPIDVAAVVTELTCICERLTALAGSSSAIPTSLDTGLRSISDAISNAPPTDLKPLVDVLEKLYKTIDVPFEVYQGMADRGLISPELLQAIGAGEFGAGVVSVITDFVKTALVWLLEHVGIKWTGTSFSLSPLATSIASVIDIAVTDALTAGAAPVYPAIRGLVDAVVGVLIPTAPPELGDVHVDPDLIISKTLAPALILNGVMLVASYFGWDVNESLREYVDVASEFIGLQEVRELKVGALMRFGPMRVAEMNARRVYRQELPGAGALAALAGRGLITTDRYGQIAPLTGVPTELQGPTLEAGQSGLNARMMLRLVGTGLFSDADVVDELTFAGMRQTSQHRLVLAAAYLGTEPERGKLRSALESTYRAGMISDNEFVSRLESAEHNTDRTNLLLETVQLEKQVVLAKEYESAYSREFLAGLLDAPGYQSALESLGMQPPDIAARMFRDETHLNVTTSIQAARQARALQRAEASAERKTAIEAYRAGASNEAALAAALLGTGLSATQVAAVVAYQTLAASGVERWIYGLRLPPSQATLLRQRVSDLTRQREISMLTDAQYVSALTALGIPSNYINALRAGANAHVSPKTAAILTPVATGP